MAPDVSRILYVKSLPFKITSEEMFDIFGRFGAIRQIRLGSTPETRGKAYVVFEDIFDAQTALEKLTGFNILGRYIVVLYFHKTGAGAGDKNKKAGAAAGDSARTASSAVSAPQARVDLAKKRAEIEAMKLKFGVKGMEE